MSFLGVFDFCKSDTLWQLEDKSVHFPYLRLKCDYIICCIRAGIKTHEKLMLHCLRKSWACNLAENGIGNKTLLELGGWSDVRVLDEFYSKASDANKKKAVEVLDRLMEE